MDEEKVISKVNDSLVAQFNGVYSWFDMIDDSDLTDEEKVWAKTNLNYKVVKS